MKCKKSKIDLPLCICVLCYSSFVCMSAYANFYFQITCECIRQINIHRSEVHCGSAFEPGGSGLPYYCTPPLCVPAVLGVTPCPRFWSLCAALRVSPASSPATSIYLSCASSNNNALSRFSPTSRTSDVAPNLAMAQILPITNPFAPEGGSSAHWQSSLDSKLCPPCRHSTTFTISSSCSLVASVSSGFGGVLQNMVTQGCFRNSRCATFRFSEIRQFWIRAQTGSEIRSLRWIPRNWTPANQL